jgi:GNAT superfamily N-acetyltransferase
LTIRLATEEDFPELVRMARNFHEASPYSGLEFSEIQCLRLFQRYLEDKTSVMILMSDYGMLIAHASQAPFSSDRISAEVAWWVDPEGRGQRDSLLLFEAYEVWSRKVGCKLCQVAMLPSVTDLSKFYERRGYKLLEQSYVKEF